LDKKELSAGSAVNELRFLGVGHRKKMTLSSALIEAITLNQMAAKELESGDDGF
jgi:hypothetical protein